jgi:hypothetical protein
MEPEVRSQAAAKDEREWELADEDLDRPRLQAFSGVYRYCAGYSFQGRS